MLAEAVICAGNLFRFLLPEVLWKSTNYCSHRTVVRCLEQIKHIFGKKTMICLHTHDKSERYGSTKLQIIEISCSWLCFRRTNPIPLLQRRRDQAVPGRTFNSPEAQPLSQTTLRIQGSLRKKTKFSNKEVLQPRVLLEFSVLHKSFSASCLS